MIQGSWLLKLITIGSLFIGTTGFVSDKGLPVIKGKKVVAIVNGDSIPLDELNHELATLHQEVKGEEKVGKEKVSDLLRRLINTRLIIQEAKRMGLHEIKE